MSHVVGRARAQGPHVERRDVGVGLGHLDAVDGGAEDLGGDLRHRGVGPLPHVRRADLQVAASVGIDGQHRDGRGRRDGGLVADGDAAAALDRAPAPIERAGPVHPPGQFVQHIGDGVFLHDRAGRLRPALAQDILLPELQRVDAELAGDHVGVALVGPAQLWNAEAAARRGDRPIGIDLGRVDLDVVDLVGPRRREAGLLRHPRTDVGIGPAVPDDMALPRGDASVAVDDTFDLERAGVGNDRVELLFHRQQQADRPARQQAPPRPPMLRCGYRSWPRSRRRDAGPSRARDFRSSPAAARSRSARTTASASWCAGLKCLRSASPSR